VHFHKQGSSGKCKDYRPELQGSRQISMSMVQAPRHASFNLLRFNPNVIPTFRRFITKSLTIDP
jgi:hypothetical protein